MLRGKKLQQVAKNLPQILAIIALWKSAISPQACYEKVSGYLFDI